MTQIGFLRSGRRWIGMIAFLLVAALGEQAQAQGQQFGPATNLPLPRFVSLKSNVVNIRVGPGSDYPIAWTYVRFGLPVEITQEFDNWRRVRDSSGNEGWVLGNLLSGDRSVVVSPSDNGDPLPVRVEANDDGRITALLEEGVVASVNRCRDGWCRLVDSRFTGWVEQVRLWGVYPGEEFD